MALVGIKILSACGDDHIIVKALTRNGMAGND